MSKRAKQKQTGGAMVEYVLLIVLVGLGVVAATRALGFNLSAAFGGAGQTLSSSSGNHGGNGGGNQGGGQGGGGNHGGGN